MKMDVPRFVSIVSCLSSLVQSIAWSVLSLLAVLSYSCAIKAEVSQNFGNLIAITYFQGCDPRYEVSGLTPPSTLAIISSIYLFLSIMWVVASAMWLYSLGRNKNDRMLHICESLWIGVTIATSLFDLGVVITFGVDYSKSGGYSVAVTLMSIAARGYVLWILNTAAAVYLAVNITRHHETQHDPHTLHSNPASVYNPDILERAIPEPWIVQSPTVGNELRQPERDYDTRTGVIYAKDLLRREPPPLDEVPRRPAIKTQLSKTSVSYEAAGRRQMIRQPSALSATFFQQARPAPFKLGPPRPPRRRLQE